MSKGNSFMQTVDRGLDILTGITVIVAVSILIVIMSPLFLIGWIIGKIASLLSRRG